MSYKAELESKYAAVKARIYGSKPNVVNERAVVAAQQALWDTPPYTFDDLEPPAQVGGVAGPTGVILPEPLVKSGLTPLVDTKQTYMNMLRFIAKKHKIDPELIQGPKRFKRIVAARHELWWRVKTEMNYSYSRIARLAHRDHSTIIHAVEMFAAKALDKGEGQVQSDRTA